MLKMIGNYVFIFQLSILLLLYCSPVPSPHPHMKCGRYWHRIFFENFQNIFFRIFFFFRNIKLQLYWNLWHWKLFENIKKYISSIPLLFYCSAVPDTVLWDAQMCGVRKKNQYIDLECFYWKKMKLNIYQKLTLKKSLMYIVLLPPPQKKIISNIFVHIFFKYVSTYNFSLSLSHPYRAEEGLTSSMKTVWLNSELAYSILFPERTRLEDGLANNHINILSVKYSLRIFFTNLDLFWKCWQNMFSNNDFDHLL